MQVSEAVFRYGRHLDARVVPIYGGQPIFRQLQALDRGVDVVVGTPGRVLDHIGRWEPRLKATYALDPDAALEAARASEARWMKGQPLSAGGYSLRFGFLRG